MWDMADDLYHRWAMMESHYESIEENWEKWFHRTKDWKEILLRNMWENHLRNTINYFSQVCDTSILQRELDNFKT